MIVTLAILVIAAGGFWLQDRSHRVTLNDTIGHYEAALAWERTRCDNLIVQVQANSQGLQHYPMLGPTPDEPPSRYHQLTDDTGLISVEFDPDEDDLFNERL